MAGYDTPNYPYYSINLHIDEVFLYIQGNLLSNVGTPSTVILSIDGTQQEIPISFHIDPATALGAVQEDQGIVTSHKQPTTVNSVHV